MSDYTFGSGSKVCGARNLMIEPKTGLVTSGRNHEQSMFRFFSLFSGSEVKNQKILTAQTVHTREFFDCESIEIVASLLFFHPL